MSASELAQRRGERPDYGAYDPRTIFFTRVDPDACYVCDEVLPRNPAHEPAAKQHWIPVTEHGHIRFHNDRYNQTREVCATCRTLYTQADGDEQRFIDDIRQRQREIEATRHRGIRYHRVISDRWTYLTSGEVVFSDAWEAVNQKDAVLRRITSRLQCEEGDPGAYLTHDGLGAWRDYARDALEGGLTLRDRAVAATVIQWLGTNIGIDWLQETLDAAKQARCGMVERMRGKRATP